MTRGDDHIVVVGDEDGVEQLRQFDSLEEGDAAEKDSFIHISMFPCSYLQKV